MSGFVPRSQANRILRTTAPNGLHLPVSDEQTRSLHLNIIFLDINTFWCHEKEQLLPARNLHQRVLVLGKYYIPFEKSKSQKFSNFFYTFMDALKNCTYYS